MDQAIWLLRTAIDALVDAAQTVSRVGENELALSIEDAACRVDETLALIGAVSW